MERQLVLCLSSLSNVASRSSWKRSNTARASGTRCVRTRAFFSASPETSNSKLCWSCSNSTRRTVCSETEPSWSTWTTNSTCRSKMQRTLPLRWVTSQSPATGLTLLTENKNLLLTRASVGVENIQQLAEKNVAARLDSEVVRGALELGVACVGAPDALEVGNELPAGAAVVDVVGVAVQNGYGQVPVVARVQIWVEQSPPAQHEVACLDRRGRQPGRRRPAPDELLHLGQRRDVLHLEWGLDSQVPNRRNGPAQRANRPLLVLGRRRLRRELDQRRARDRHEQPVAVRAERAVVENQPAAHRVAHQNHLIVGVQVSADEEVHIFVDARVVVAGLHVAGRPRRALAALVVEMDVVAVGGQLVEEPEKKLVDVSVAVDEDNAAFVVAAVPVQKGGEDAPVVLDFARLDGALQLLHSRSRQIAQGNIRGGAPLHRRCWT
ncbi:hypothetical protein KL923_003998 [Ogataea haglerorum]|nr:hypothetical protein KL923_003998 [Ogataea haglerorum]